MQIKDISSALFLGVGFVSYASAGVIEGNPTRSLHARAPQNNNGNGNNAAAPTLAANAVQTGSANTGQNPPVAGQSNSLTDTSNFINFCAGKTLTNGIQVKGGSCNGIVMGEIPASTQMVSSIILNPPPGGNIAANTDFNIQVAMSNLAAGSFTNAAATYYSAPQKLNAQGLIIGHTHVTVQDMGNSLTPGKPLDPSVFAFFKGINDAGTGGVLSAVVAGGLPPGNYRVCSMSAASNHQPVLMPVAQRGAQDDCNKFTVGGAAGNGAAAAGNNGGNNAGTATSSAISATSSAGNGAATGNNAGNNGGKKGGKNAGTATSSASSATSSVASSAGNGAATGNNAGNNGGNKANVQPFTGSLGGSAVPVQQVAGGRPFVVNGNSFVNFAAACQRSCDVQHNTCADAANAGKQSFSVGDCGTQQQTCNAGCSAGQAKRVKREVRWMARA